MNERVKPDLYVRISDNVLDPHHWPVRGLFLGGPDGGTIIGVEEVTTSIAPAYGWSDPLSPCVGMRVGSGELMLGTLAAWLGFDGTGSHPERYHELSIDAKQWTSGFAVARSLTALMRSRAGRTAADLGRPGLLGALYSPSPPDTELARGIRAAGEWMTAKALEAVVVDGVRIELRPVRSSNIRAIGYDVITMVLVIEFTNGGRYRYDGVPASAHSDLIEAQSAGSHFARHVRDKFPTRKLEGSK